MSTIQLNSKDFASQTSSAEPVIASGVTFPTGFPLNRAIAYMPADVSYHNSLSMNNFWSPTYDPVGGANNTSTIWAYLHLKIWTTHSSTSAGANDRKKFDYLISGDDITNHQSVEDQWCFGGYQWASHSFGTAEMKLLALAPVTLDGTGNAVITYAFDIGNEVAHASCGVDVHGGGCTDALKTHIQFIEVV